MGTALHPGLIEKRLEGRDWRDFRMDFHQPVQFKVNQLHRTRAPVYFFGLIDVPALSDLIGAMCPYPGCMEAYMAGGVRAKNGVDAAMWEPCLDIRVNRHVKKHHPEEQHFFVKFDKEVGNRTFHDMLETIGICHTFGHRSNPSAPNSFRDMSLPDVADCIARLKAAYPEQGNLSMPQYKPPFGNVIVEGFGINEGGISLELIVHRIFVDQHGVVIIEVHPIPSSPSLYLYIYYIYIY
jgi:hypothetical protein